MRGHYSQTQMAKLPSVVYLLECVDHFFQARVESCCFFLLHNCLCEAAIFSKRSMDSFMSISVGGFSSKNFDLDLEG